MKDITIIGGGLSGLSASCYLAKNNYNVTLIDKNEDPGGRLSKINESGFTFDLGPSWYWMPDVFEKFFNDFDKSVSDYYELKRLDPSYKFFINGAQYDIPAEMHVNLSIYDLRGRLVSELVNQMQTGSYDAYQVVWNAEMQSSGVYFVKLTAGGKVQTQKIMLIK